LQAVDLYLGGTITDVILAALKLRNALSAFADGWAGREILNGFGWDAKVCVPFRGIFSCV
jgi:hypothetical protein